LNAKGKPQPTISRRIENDGLIYTYDSTGRCCFDLTQRERIMLKHDLRVYGTRLHIGALGWTVPGIGDGYTFAEVVFDSGEKYRIRNYALERVAESLADTLSCRFIAEKRNTRFDADIAVAEALHEQWIEKTYGGFLNLEAMIRKGKGDQELYAFTFPALRELSNLKGCDRYPMKIGYSGSSFDGALGRIRSQISEKAGFPEKPHVLCIFRTWDGRYLEKQVHKSLRSLGRKAPQSLGKEWFVTSTEELLQIIESCELLEMPADRILVGADETIEEGFSKLLAEGSTIEIGLLPGQASVSIGIRRPTGPSNDLQ
jgi:hypothetical protein